MSQEKLEGEVALKSLGYEECDSLVEFLVREFQGSACVVGQLHFGEAMKPGDVDELLSEMPGGLHSGGTWFHEIDVVIDLERGALLMRDCSRFSGESPAAFQARVIEEYKELHALEIKIRGRLRKSQFWCGKKLPVATVIVVCALDSAELELPEGVAAAAIVAGPDVARFKENLAALFEAVLPVNADRGEEALKRICRDLTETRDLGGFVDAASWGQMYREWDEEDAPPCQCEGG